MVLDVISHINFKNNQDNKINIKLMDIDKFFIIIRTKVNQ